MDVLRGVSVLGILLVNIYSFAMPIDALYTPYTDPPPSTLDVWGYGLVSVFATGKFMSLFALLFGAGVAMMFDRRRQRSEPAAGLHYRRVGTLAALGFVHGVFIWYGDILLAYAMCGALLYPLLLLKDRTLRWVWAGAWGLALISTLGYGALMAWLVSMAPEGESTARIFENEVDLMRGGFLDIAKVRLIHWLAFLIMGPFVTLPWCLALMLTGVQAIRGGWVTGKRSTRDYKRLLVLGLLLGLPIAGLRTTLSLIEQEQVYLVFGLVLNVLDGLALSSAWMALVMLAVQAQWFGVLRRALGAVGRMALTNYIAQSLICTLLFYGYGLGWFGSFSRTQLLGVVLGVWLVQLLWSPWWLGRFERGPLEHAWRRLTYGPSERRARIGGESA